MRPWLPGGSDLREDGAMAQKAAKQFPPELRGRAVRMVQDREREGGTQWESVGSGDFAARSADIAAKIGCSRETLRR